MFDRLPILREIYTDDWECYRIRRHQLFATFVVLVPSTAVAVICVSQFVDNDLVITLIIAPAAIAWILTLLRLTAFTCPRCRKAYFHGVVGGNLLTQHCLHCNLAKWKTCNDRERKNWLDEPDWRCLNCRIDVDSNVEICPRCGWTYDDISD